MISRRECCCRWSVGDGPDRRGRGFTVIELLVTVTIIGLLVALLLPAVQSARESARRFQCGNNLHQLGAALNSYASVYNVLPLGANSNGYSWMSQLLPFEDQGALYNSMNMNIDVSLAAMQGGQNFTCAATRLSLLLCPSESVPPGSESNAKTNYAANGGYGLQAFGFNGAFVDGLKLESASLAAVNDGTSQTTALSEWVVGLRALAKQDPVIAMFNTERLTLDDEFEEFVVACRDVNTATSQSFGVKPCRWYNGEYAESLYNHVLPPNGHTCLNGGSLTFSSVAASSRHPAGINVLFVDGHVKFIRQTIDLITWRALSTRSGGEVISESDY
jgi:prepilin-type processing-associated H-X9-DG protein/prepilin-type N-terminal cleavage/methylation domain-containing protein